MKTEEEIKDRLAQEKEIIDAMIAEPYNPNQPQLTNLMCILASMETLKWILFDIEE